MLPAVGPKMCIRDSFWGEDLSLLLEPAGVHPIQAGYELYAACAGALLQAKYVD